MGDVEPRGGSHGSCGASGLGGAELTDGRCEAKEWGDEQGWGGGSQGKGGGDKGAARDGGWQGLLHDMHSTLRLSCHIVSCFVTSRHQGNLRPKALLSHRGRNQ